MRDDVNLFGAARLPQLVLPSLRNQKSGTVSNVSSIGGERVLPLAAWYNASEHALEAYSDTLRQEVRNRASRAHGRTVEQRGPGVGREVARYYGPSHMTAFAGGFSMTGQAVPMRIGDVEVLVQTVPVVGTERVSRAADAGQKVLDAFERAHDVIVGAAASTVEVMSKLGQRAARPDKIEVEFGLGFSLKGNVIVVSGSADATLKVKLTYEPKPAE